MTTRNKKLVLIDGNALIHRAFHAFFRANLTTASGEPTGAVYGFTVMLLNIHTKLKPDYIIVTLDSGKPTFRHEEYAEYKATRAKAPQELYSQIPRIQELIETFNMPVFVKDGFEADDLIGTLAHQAPGSIDVFIATGDMDALQLVNDHVFVYAPGKGFSDIVLYTPQTVKDLKGLNPEQFVDFKGLRGDPSDNIPGVPGIGEVTAKKLLNEYGTMENIYAHLDELPNRTKELLKTNEKQAIQSKRLATILRDVPIELDLKKAEFVEFDSNKVKDLFTKLGFRSLIARIPHGTLTETSQTSFFEQPQKEPTQPPAKKGRLSLTDKLDRDLEPVLRKMEKAGILLDVDLINALNDKVATRLAELTKKIYKYAKQEFNINSPSQLATVLFEKLKLPTDGIARTKTGYSTAVSELEKLSGAHPIIQEIFEYRQLEKLRNTYLETLPQAVDKHGRIHTTYGQDTSTGRLSSNNPNLQNIPIRSDIGAEIRKAFIAPPGFKLVVADYSQIELRVAAHIAKDKTMMESFLNNEDIHTRVAAEVHGVKLSEVTADQRRNAKVINFGILYGVSAWGLAARTNMTVAEASNYINKYFELYPNIKKYMRDTVAFVQQNGYAETLLGRRRYFTDIDSRIPAVRNAAQRAAINMPIQGTAADIMKAAMVEVDKELPKVSKKSRMLLQVHDELVLEVPEKDVAKVSKLLESKMENVIKLDVPIVAEAQSGNSWGEAK